MATRGIVSEINDQLGMVAIETEGGFTIVELTSPCDIARGHQIWWADDTGSGSQTYKNLTTGDAMEVMVSNHYVPRSQLRQQLHYLE